jgi:cytochrome c oxidase subunit 4
MKPSATVTPAKYLAAYLALLLLLVATFVIAHFNLGKLGVPIALLIASAKAFLVVLYFMHLRYQTGILRAAAGLGVFWLGILMTLTLSDYLTRHWLPLPGPWPQSFRSKNPTR